MSQTLLRETLWLSKRPFNKQLFKPHLINKQLLSHASSTSSSLSQAFKPSIDNKLLSQASITGI